MYSWSAFSKINLITGLHTWIYPCTDSLQSKAHSNIVTVTAGCGHLKSLDLLA